MGGITRRPASNPTDVEHIALHARDDDGELRLAG